MSNGFCREGIYSGPKTLLFNLPTFVIWTVNGNLPFGLAPFMCVYGINGVCVCFQLLFPLYRKETMAQESSRLHRKYVTKQGLKHSIPNLKLAH